MSVPASREAHTVALPDQRVGGALQLAGAQRSAATAQARLEMLFDQLKDLIKKNKPDTAAVEKLFFSRNVTTALAVGQARGVIMLGLQKAGLEAFEYTPNEVKQAVAGYGGADKRQVQDMVRALLQLDSIPKPDDAADALAIAITHLHTRRD